MNKAFLTIIAFAFIACNDEPQRLVYTNDAEQSLGWINQNTLKASQDAHSGAWVSSTDSSLAYSLTLRQGLSEVNKIGANRITAKAWIKFMSMAGKGGLVISVDDNGKNLLWQMLPVESLIEKPGQWKMVKYEVTLPKDAPATAVVSTYFWNQGKDEIQVDDMEVYFDKK